MSNHRQGRIAQEILKRVTQILNENVRDPRVEGVTLTDVEVTGDLQQAKVFYSTLDDSDKKKAATQEGLEQASGLIRKELGQYLTTYHTPELLFRRDESLEYGNRIDQLLKQLHSENE
ncbi:30S ribosome-binding factor RbfA [Allofustis seminis]|uniref:30S ribosome-binding factor RbfA n=1 Tax=Allofustis seminis TaxID=166939 RepID=UPI000361771C|nr:30S ribosome-binding factor RbfA [Allofustis seminis]